MCCSEPLKHYLGGSSRPRMNPFLQRRCVLRSGRCCQFRRRGHSPTQALFCSFSCSVQRKGNLPHNPQGWRHRRVAWVILTLRGSLFGSAPCGESLLFHPLLWGPRPLLPSSFSKAPKPTSIAWSTAALSLRAPGCQSASSPCCVLSHALPDVVCH